jgi:hypothetical protein
MTVLSWIFVATTVVAIAGILFVRSQWQREKSIVLDLSETLEGVLDAAGVSRDNGRYDERELVRDVKNGKKALVDLKKLGLFYDDEGKLVTLGGTVNVDDATAAKNISVALGILGQNGGNSSSGRPSGRYS